jgi:hypothetical protein
VDARQAPVVPITVYWACLEDEWMAAKAPDSVLANFYKKDLLDHSNDMSSVAPCPGFNGNLKNVFALRSLYDYSFTVSSSGVSTDKYDQDFFESHVLIRSLEKKLFSFKNRYIFFTNASDLEVTLYEHPYLEDNNIAKTCMPITGKFNIGKWFRNSDYAFYLKKDCDTFTIEQEEIYSYIRFHTEEQIIFKQFRYAPIFDSYQKDCFSLTKLGLKQLNKYYTTFKIKNLVLQGIEENLV